MQAIAPPTRLFFQPAVGVGAPGLVVVQERMAAFWIQVNSIDRAAEVDAEAADLELEPRPCHICALHAERLLEEARLQSALSSPALVPRQERAQVGADGRRRVLPNERMSGDAAPLAVGEALERDVLDEPKVGAGIGVQALETTSAPQLFEESLENQMDE